MDLIINLQLLSILGFHSQILELQFKGKVL